MGKKKKNEGFVDEKVNLEDSFKKDEGFVDDEDEMCSADEIPIQDGADCWVKISSYSCGHKSYKTYAMLVGSGVMVQNIIRNGYGLTSSMCFIEGASISGGRIL